MDISSECPWNTGVRSTRATAQLAARRRRADRGPTLPSLPARLRARKGRLGKNEKANRRCLTAVNGAESRTLQRPAGRDGEVGGCLPYRESRATVSASSRRKWERGGGGGSSAAEDLAARRRAPPCAAGLECCTRLSAALGGVEGARQHACACVIH